MDRILVFSPHPDDEVLGCGGYIAKQKIKGAQVHVVVVSDGALGVQKGTSPEVRKQECLAGLGHLDIDNVQFWDYPDGAIPLSGGILHEYRRIVNEIKPTEILLPHPQEPHSDHVRVTRGILNALEEQWQGNLLFYETVLPVPVVNHIVDITTEFGAKMLAMQAHVSQTKQFDYANTIQSLARLRGIHANATGAEAFLLYEWDGTSQHFFETRPLISVIVRANELDYLRYALNSLIRQTYEQFEVILVWFGEYAPSLKDFEVLDIRFVPGKTSRTFNLNEGLRHARGEYIAFLDQDDIVYPQHLAALLAEIHGHPKVDVTYSGCKVVACEKQDARIKVKKVMEVMNHVWQPGRLLMGNQIPLHALLFRAGVFRTHQFDETLEAYEDWELLARLSLSHFHFVHLNEITCEYRIFGDKNESYTQLHENKGYLEHRQTVLAKILQRMEASHLDNISNIVKDLGTEHAQLSTQLAKQAKQHQAEIGALNYQLAQYQGLEELLTEACADIGIEAAGRQAVAQLIGRTLPQQTLFSIILPVYNTDPTLLSETLLSLRNQAFANWELCLVDDGSDREETQQLLQTLQNDPIIAKRLHFSRRDTQGGIVKASNDAIKMATAPYVVFLDHDDRLHNEALLLLALKLQQRDYTLLYTDSRMIDHAGKPMHTYHKADWSPETLLHLNYINHLTVVKRDVLNRLGGLDFDGAQDWNLLLQLINLPDEQVCHLRQPLYDWRATEGSLAYKTREKKWAFKTAQSAVKNHLTQRALEKVTVLVNKRAAGCIPQWHFPQEPVDIIIPTHNNLRGLKICLNGLLQQTDYPQINIIIVANRCIEPVQDYLNTLQSHPQIKISVNEDEFNWSALNNQGVLSGNNPNLLFLNDDIEIKHANWLRNMSRYLYLDGVGAVGATLFYPNKRLQHNGIETHPEWIARNIDEWGAKNPLRITRNVSAVTGACLLTQRSVWEKVNGFDEKISVYYNDVDFCLAIRAHELRIVQANDVELTHHEKVTYGKDDNPEKQALSHKEINFMQEKWGEQLAERYMPRYDVQAKQTRILHVK
jgi:glycosyltransferase involved in cell wall biosynthesis/LmbE family N-acetylglucosaminyl deacetylase